VSGIALKAARYDHLEMFTAGSGPPLVVIPGLQGRWEWFRPALESLATRCRVTSYSLCGDLGSGSRWDPALGFENDLRQLDAILERFPGPVALCGVSYGGFVASRYAAARPGRVACLIVVSSPAPGWKPNPIQQQYLRRPWLNAPRFVLSSPMRLWPEIRSACGSAGHGLAFIVRYGLRAARHPMIPGLMARRIREQQRLDLSEDLSRIHLPTLVVSGEPTLDRVVPVESTRQYAERIPGAKYVMIERTGHIGLMTRPDAFARIVAQFVHEHAHDH
jgi:3-oxoadipate enol-lactonase